MRRNTAGLTNVRLDEKLRDGIMKNKEAIKNPYSAAVFGRADRIQISQRKNHQVTTLQKKQDICIDNA